MLHFNKTLSCVRRKINVAATVALSVATAACGVPVPTGANPPDATLSIGFGENPEVGIQQTVRNIALEGLVRIDRDGRPTPWLAERWVVAPDGMTLRLTLRPGATFHNGEPATAEAIRDIVAKDLPDYVGLVFDDIERIQASAPHELEFSLKRRSSFLLEGLDLLIQQSGELPIGTGPFSVINRAPAEVEMHANSTYYGGKPLIDRIVFKSYDSVRSAWADLLRGRVDMVYEVGIDAVDSLSLSTQTKVFTFQRPYAFLVILNVRNPKLQEKALRRALNAAIDREALVAHALNNHATPADGPVWPHHWAYGEDLPHFRFQPHAVNNGRDAVRLSCLLMTDRSHERVGLAIQRQLRAVGVELALEEMPSDRLLARLQAGDFEMLLVDARMGPSILQQYLFWHSKGPNNWGHFSSREVDTAFDLIRTAPDDSTYKEGVVALQHALVDDPPAIFLTWAERLRAVSARFEVHQEPGRDITSTLRLWRPLADGKMISPN